MLVLWTIAAMATPTAVAQDTEVSTPVEEVDDQEAPEDDTHYLVRITPGLMFSPLGAKARVSYLVTRNLSIMAGGGGGGSSSASQSMVTGGFDLHLSGRGYRGAYLGLRSRMLHRDAPPTFNWLNQLSNVGRDTFANYGILGLGGVSDNGLAYHFGLGGGWKRQVVVAADLRGGVLQGCAVFAEFGLGLAVGRGRR